ncbi:MAG: caspase family protein [Planctomycetaceae bacterium]|nr:caspase family protein [Planctomycetaceae bacterium]MCB9951677.1 caspase family protein [Planctomycetaceae bacterium]
MSSRALIVAVQEYPDSVRTSKSLPGVTENALKFRQWLVDFQGVQPEDIVCCLSSDNEYRNFGTSRAEISRAIRELMRLGLNDTEKLFVFISGHGVMCLGDCGSEHVDALLCSDFVDLDSGAECIRIQELTTVLARRLGAGSHVWFLDICRTKDKSLLPSQCGFQQFEATTGSADWFRLFSARSGNAAANDSTFVDLLVTALAGDVPRQQIEKGDDGAWITFKGVAHAMERALAEQSQGVESHSSGKSDCPIRSIEKAGPVATIVAPNGSKIPPLELLIDYDEIIFLGETNGQLSEMLEKAFVLRSSRKWKKLQIFSIKELMEAARPGKTLEELELERKNCEDYFSEEAPNIADELVLGRYDYIGTYGSFWKAESGKRRVHVSARIQGLDIRRTPSMDFVDFPNNEHPDVNRFFEEAEGVATHPSTEIVFQYPTT